MDLPDGYLAALTDELAPFGFDLGVAISDGGQWQLRFDTEPEAFVRQYPWADIDASYGDEWPPGALELWIRGEFSDVIEISFEVYDVLLWAQGESPELAGRLATLDDPADQAAAVGQAVGEVLQPPGPPSDTYEDLG